MAGSTDKTVAALRSLLPQLRERFGVSSLAVFGSCARGEGAIDSDVDVLVSFQADAKVTLFTLAAMTRLLEEAVGTRVDLVEDHPRLRPAFRQQIQKDLLRVA